jgi:LPXTG-motif cell wall-anchored protein
MRITNRLLCLLIVLTLVVPAAAAVPTIAFGQSAGDDQYVDPFQDNGTGGKNNDSGSGGGNNGGSNNGGSDNSASQQPTGESNSGDTAGTTAAQNSANDSNSKLPHTGSDFPEGWIVALGVVLLLGGFVLRRAWPRPD